MVHGTVHAKLEVGTQKNAIIELSPLSSSHAVALWLARAPSGGLFAKMGSSVGPPVRLN